MTGNRAPEDMVRVVRAIFELKQRSELADAGALISWLSGSSNVGATAKKKAEIEACIRSKDALAYLRGILEIVKAAGYAGLVIVVDELETVLRARTDTRGKSLNGLRDTQNPDAAKDFPGLFWIFSPARPTSSIRAAASQGSSRYTTVFGSRSKVRSSTSGSRSWSSCRSTPHGCAMSPFDCVTSTPAGPVGVSRSSSRTSSSTGSSPT